MNGVGTKTIETDRLILRKMSIDDCRQVFDNWTSDKLVSKYVTWDVHTDIEETREYISSKIGLYEKEYFFDWLVEIKATGELIGEINAVRVSRKDRLVEMGYCFGSKFWNKGYGTEALKAFIGYMFNKVEVDKIIAKHISTNPASGKAMLKAGMKFDGILKEYVVDKNTGKREDFVHYSIDRK